MKWYEQLIKYVIAGICGVGIDAGIYAIFMYIGFSISVSKLIGIFTSVVFSYVVNTLWSFKSSITLINFVKFCVLYSFSIAFNVLTNSITITKLEELNEPFSFFIAFLVATFISICITFFGLKFWIYKK